MDRARKRIDDCLYRSGQQRCHTSTERGNHAGGANGGADGGKNDAHKDASSDPSAGLDALDKLKSQISCPVDLKSLAGSM